MFLSRAKRSLTALLRPPKVPRHAGSPEGNTKGPASSACGPACAHRAAQGLQVAGQGLQLPPVVVGLMLGLAEQLRVAGGGVVQVRKLDEERALCWRAVWGRISRELSGPRGVGTQSGGSGRWAGR